MSDLELRITTPKVPYIDWAEERAKLKKAVEARLEKFKGIKYSEDEINLAKADRALLNRFAKALDERRKDIKRVYEAPIKQFTVEANEIIGLINNTNANIDKQIKDYEERKRIEKLSVCREIFEELIGDLGGFVSYEQIANERWLNATYTLAKVKEDISKKIEQIRNELITINALKSEDEATLKAFYFKTLSLADALIEHERLKEMRQKLQQDTSQNSSQEAKEETPDVAEPSVDEPTYTIAFEITATSTQLKALKAFFVENGIKYRKFIDE